MEQKPKRLKRYDALKIKARQMFIEHRASSGEIANELGVKPSTIDKWKEAGNWEHDFQAKQQSGAGMKQTLADTLQDMIAEFKNTGDTKTAEAVAKVWKVVKEIDSSVDYLGNVIWIIEDFTSFTGEYYPNLLPSLEEPIERFLAFMREKHG